jgi:hypothetical protein
MEIKSEIYLVDYLAVQMVEKKGSAKGYLKAEQMGCVSVEKLVVTLVDKWVV